MPSLKTQYNSQDQESNIDTILQSSDNIQGFPVVLMVPIIQKKILGHALDSVAFYNIDFLKRTSQLLLLDSP